MPSIHINPSSRQTEWANNKCFQEKDQILNLSVLKNLEYKQ